jgi:sugar/nucleoside kinase (ribokinase family)
LFDIISVGHFSIDSILLPSRKGPFTVLGGSTAYVSFAARRLDAKVSVVSKVGTDFPDAYRWWLEQEGVDLSGLVKVEDAQTTRYELRYNDDLSERVLKLKARAPPILVEDLADSLKAKAVHIAPIDGEVSYEVVEKLRNFAPILSLDPQGLVRNYGEDGTVTVGTLNDKRIFGLIDIFKSSLLEAEAVTATSDLDSTIKTLHDLGVKIVIVTLGKDGAAVSVENKLHRVPVAKPSVVVDPTGAGDAFIGGFLAEYVRGEDCSWSSYVGSSLASFVVEGIGPTYFGSREEVYDRARGLQEKEN